MKAPLSFRSVLFVLALSAVAWGARAQPAKFGKVTEAELQMRVYDKDTSAAAVILSDYGYSRFTFGSEVQLVTNRHIRIKILKRSGFDWANVSIPFYVKNADREKVGNIKGITYNLENGAVTKDKLEGKTVFEEQRSENWYLKKFTMPNIREGSVIDVEYTITSDFIYTLREWEFQTSIPTVWSEYRAQIPGYYDYKFLMQGYHPLYKQDKSNQAVNEGAPSDGPQMVNNAYVWIMKDVPALREEKYITTLADYQSKIEFELQQVKYPGQAAKTMTGDWDQVTRELLAADKFGTQLNRNGYFKDEIATVAAKYKTAQERMAAIHDLVKKQVKWNGKYGIYADNPLRRVFESRTGSAAEINLMLTAMLLEAGMEAAPVLVSTRSNGRPPAASPMVTKFNYVVSLVKLENKEYLLDATDPLLPAGMLPVRCLNGQGRLIRKDDQRWVSLMPLSAHTKMFSGELVIRPSGEMNGKGHESAAGYGALYMRQHVQEQGEEKYAESIGKTTGDYQISKPAFANLADVNSTLSLSYQISAAGNGQDNAMLYLNPMLGHGEKENPFKLTERTYPVDFAAPIDETFVCRYIMPEGYEVEEAPKNVVLALPENSGRFTYVVQQEGNVVQVMSKIKIAKPVFYAPEYGNLKEFYNQIIAKHAEQIVLRKVARP